MKSLIIYDEARGIPQSLWDRLPKRRRNAGRWRSPTDEERREMIASGISPFFANNTMKIWDEPPRRPSRGYRRHVRRMKQQQRRAK